MADAIREQLSTELDKYRGRVRRAESALADAQAIVDHVEQLEQALARLVQTAGAVLDAAARADVPAAAFDARLDDLAAVLADLAGAS